MGINWDLKKDTLKINTSNQNLVSSDPCHITKRDVLSSIARVTDPLGYVSPVVIRGKICFQKICLTKIGWKDILPPDLAREFIEIKSDFDKLAEFEIPRYLFDGLDNFNYTTPIKLRIYCDASSQAYAACVYVEFVNNEGITQRRLILSKTRVSPLEKYTIPRKELLGAVLAVRLATVVKKFLSDWNITETKFYTDSLNVLFWIRSIGKQWGVFVENRVQEIHSNSSPYEWRYIPGEDNPADAPSRGITYEQLVNSKTWMNGPVGNYDHLTVNVIPMPSECEAELKKSATQMPTNVRLLPNIGNIGGRLSLDSFSDLGRLIRVSGQVIKATSLFTKKGVASEIKLREDALLHWIRTEQMSYYREEFLYATDKPLRQSQKALTPLAKQLGLFLDKSCDLLRCTTRLADADIQYQSKYPILLPRKSHLTALIINSIHEKLFHSGPTQTLSQLRTEYWIPQARKAVNEELHKCFICRKLKTDPYEIPEAPPLPAFRLEQAPAFTSTGVDMCGPVYLKSNSKKRTKKSYVALFSCCASRAVFFGIIVKSRCQCVSYGIASIYITSRYATPNVQ